MKKYLNMSSASFDRSRSLDRVSNWFARTLILLALKLPYEMRIRWFGWIVSNTVAPLAGMRKRATANLRTIMPELSDEEIGRLSHRATNNLGRLLIETYSKDDLERTCSQLPLQGAGWDAIETARRNGQPIVLVSGHFGNYSAARVALQARGYSIGAVYRPFNNQYFDAHYLAALNEYGATFARGLQGTREMVRYLKSGKCVAILADQHFASGAPLEFFGHPAKTATSAAHLALEYNALLVPFYGVRRPDGIHFDVIIEPPVAAGTPESMTQALNDSLEAIIRRHPDQWMWTHRRWK